jgi:hypothetical protein
MLGATDEVDEAWHAIEAKLIEDFDVWARGRDADEAQTRRVRNLFGVLLREAVVILRSGEVTLQ